MQYNDITQPTNSHLYLYHFKFSVERRLHIAAEENNHDAEPVLKKDQMGTMYQYLGIWVQR